MIAGVFRLGGNESEDVLIAQLLRDLCVNFVDRLLFRDFEQPAARFLGDSLEDRLAVAAPFALRIPALAAHRWTAHSRAAHSPTTAASSSEILRRLFALEQDGVDDRVRALRCFDGAFESFLAAAIDSVRKDDHGLAARLLLHQLIGREIDGVIEMRSAAAPVTSVPVSLLVRILIVARVLALRHLEQVQRRVELLGRRGQVLQKLHLMIEVNQKRLVLHILAQRLVDEGGAGGAFVAEDRSLAQAGIDQQAHGQRKLVLAREVGDRLGMAVIVERKIALRQVGEDSPLLVAHAGEHGDHVRFGRNLRRRRGRLRLRRRLLWRCRLLRLRRGLLLAAQARCDEKDQNSEKQGEGDASTQGIRSASLEGAVHRTHLDASSGEAVKKFQKVRLRSLRNSSCADRHPSLAFWTSKAATSGRKRSTLENRLEEGVPLRLAP